MQRETGAKHGLDSGGSLGHVRSMLDVLFYHLEHQPLERVLPNLIERALDRGWRVVVQAGSQERVEALDTLLWTYREDSFLPHGTKRDGNPAEQPVYLTDGDDNPNGAAVRFLVDGAAAGALAGYARLVYLFDGRDAGAVAMARELWKRAKEAGCATTYWQQSPEGRWENKA
jgi:DNA polymerase III subunit chi